MTAERGSRAAGSRYPRDRCLLKVPIGSDAWRAVALVPEGATVVTVVVRTVVIWQLRLPRTKPTPAKIAMCLKRYRSKHCAQADSNRQRMDPKS
jgi:hypothetical protein